MDISSADNDAFRVGLLLVDGFALLSFASVSEPLRAANLLSGQSLFQVRIIAASGTSTTSSGGAILPASERVGDNTDFDLLLVVAGGDPASFCDTEVNNWLRRLSRRGVRLGGVSGGPVILAAAGLMEHRRMTVHWEHAEALAERAPSLLLERSLYVIDRDRVTCAGGTAPMDLMHALIAERHGPDFARLVSDWFLHTDVRPSGGPQRAGLVARYGTTRRPVLDAIEAMENNVADPLRLDQLARFSGVTSRHLNRLFTNELGRTVMAFYRELRLDKARNLLRNSPLPMTEIALATGFTGSSHFSRVHSARFGVAPSSLRS